MTGIEMPVWVGIVVAIIAASGGWMSSRVTRKNSDHARIQTLERRVDRVEARNTLLWAYNRSLVDHIYEGKAPPPPPIPPELIKLMEEL
ncbi:MAG TPA: hypothetical protein VFU07_07060 [Candidatus Lumbricidophila sp.]|nr:hypothetical protein [Candidatus Lumbricidophila sp.]